MVDQRVGPAPQRRGQVLIERGGAWGQADHGRSQPPRYRPCEQDAVDMTEHRRLLRHAPASKVIRPLELGEKALRFPAERVGQADLLGAEPLGGNVGQVKMVLSRLLVPEPDGTPLPDRWPVPIERNGAGLPLQAHGNPDRHVEDLTLEVRKDLPQGPSVEWDRIAPARHVRVGDGGMKALLEAGQEVAAMPVDPGEVPETLVAQVEDQQGPLDARVDRGELDLAPCSLGDLDLVGPAAVGAEDDVELDASRHPGTRPLSRHCIAEPEDGAVLDEGLIEAPKAVGEPLGGKDRLASMGKEASQELYGPRVEVLVEAGTVDALPRQSLVLAQDGCNAGARMGEDATDQRPEETNGIEVSLTPDEADLTGQGLDHVGGKSLLQNGRGFNRLISSHGPGLLLRSQQLKDLPDLGFLQGLQAHSSNLKRTRMAFGYS